MSQRNFNHFEQCAAEVIKILKPLSEFADTKVAIIGGLALCRYMPWLRATKDIDFITTAKNAPDSVKQKLLNLPNSPFEDCAGIFFYQSPTGPAVQIDMTPEWQSPYVPEAAEVVSEVVNLPYISMIDLIVFKINSCGLRATKEKKRRDANDALALLELATNGGALDLTFAQRKPVFDGLMDVVEITGLPEAWWKNRLGL